ncbi:MAG: tetratricopeptide repeat protein [Proteobacteria bacterium]|nr:tetratricopeptide repeat protein [Pseudomonadota bacterium]
MPGVFTIPPQAAQKAVDACLAAARAFQKEPRFDYQLARAYLAAGDTMEANRFFLDAIRFSTSPAAFGTYGRIREIGQIGRNRPDIAARYYQGGYRRGDVIAKLHLARLYHFGIEVKRNCRAADAFYRELESEGFSAAQFGLGQIYSEGLCRPVDHSVAFNWYLKSANAGYKPAAKAVAIAYRLGRGTEKNLSEFKRWSSKAGD